MAKSRPKSTRKTTKVAEKSASRRSRALRDIENNAEQGSNRVDDSNDEPAKSNKNVDMVDPPRNAKRQRKAKQSYVEDPIASDDDESSIHQNDDDDDSDASSFSNKPVTKGGKKLEKSKASKNKGKTNNKPKVTKTKGSTGKLAKAVKVSLSPSVRSIDISPTLDHDDTIVLRDWRVSGALDY